MNYHTEIDSRIAIGLKFRHYANKTQYEVYDLLTTKNYSGQITKIEVLCKQMYFGQDVFITYPQSTVIRSI